MTHAGPGCQCERTELQDGGDWLARFVETNNVVCANEAVVGSGLTIFKEHPARFSPTSCQSLEADEDSAELLFSIPFTTPCTLHQLYCLSADSHTFPSKVKIWANHPDLDFSLIEDVPCVQEFDIVPDLCGNTGHPLKVSKLKLITSVQMYFTGTPPMINLKYIGLRGQASGHKREAVTTVYEAKPNLADHQVKGTNSAKWNV